MQLKISQLAGRDIRNSLSGDWGHAIIGAARRWPMSGQ
jgi:hypothetical protein